MGGVDGGESMKEDAKAAMQLPFLKDLHRLKVETGSLACLGCGREQSCGTHGCAILREAERVILALYQDLKDLGDCAACRYNEDISDDSPCIRCMTQGEGWEWKGRDGCRQPD